MRSGQAGIAVIWELSWPTSGGYGEGMTWRNPNPVTYLVEIPLELQSIRKTCVHCHDIPATHEIVFFGLDEGESAVCLDCAGDLVAAGQVMFTIPWVDGAAGRRRGDGLSWKEDDGDGWGVTGDGNV